MLMRLIPILALLFSLGAHADTPANESNGEIPGNPNTSTPNKGNLENDNQKVSYSFGLIFGKRLIKDVPSIDLDIFMQGLTDGFQGNPTQLNDQQVADILTQFQQQQQQQQLQQLQKLAIENKQKGEQFLLANREKEGINILPSGLQYKILIEGTGSTPTAEDTVKLEYVGSRLNGKVFDRSEPGKPVSVAVNKVIQGWTDALLRMPVGSKWQIFVPSELAYGPDGYRGIGPNETLLYEMTLLSIENNKDSNPAAPTSTTE